MQNWEFFYFLWDDPLFLDETLTGDPKEYVDDPEFIVLRRQMRLLALERLYIKIQNLEADLDREKAFHREAQAREAWTVIQFLKHVSSETAENVLIERKVNDMDRDFSFEQAISGLDSPFET